MISHGGLRAWDRVVEITDARRRVLLADLNPHLSSLNWLTSTMAPPISPRTGSLASSSRKRLAESDDESEALELAERRPGQ